MKDIIAERDLAGIGPEGTKFQITLKIGRPYMVESEDWACAVGAIGLYKRMREVHGNDSFQALMRAIKMARRLLEYFIEDGGSLVAEEDGTPVEIAAIFI